MKTKWIALVAAGVVGAGTCVGAWARHQEPGALKPGPEMERLSKLYVGEWTYTETYPKSPMAPNGGQQGGVYTSKPGPGGFSLINSFHSQGPMGNFEGLLMITWDPREKAYKGYFFADSAPGALVETGQFENDALVFRAELDMGNGPVKFRNVTRFLDGGKLTSEQYITAPGAAEALLVHVDAKKK